MNIGPAEILLLAIFALILFGPKRLPEIGRQVGRALAEVRRVSREFEREVREATEPFEQEVRATAEPFEHEVREAERIARESYSLDPDHSRYLAPGGSTDSEPGDTTRD